MHEPSPTAVQAPEVSIPSGAEESVALRRYMRDLAALLALPAMWSGHDPAYIADGLLGVLSSLLRLDSAYVRFDDPSGGPALAGWSPRGARVPAELEHAMAVLPPTDRTTRTVSLQHPEGDETVRVTIVRPSLPGEDGIVLAGSRRVDFPSELESFLLRVAVGQSAIAIRAARLLAREQAARGAAEAALRRKDDFLGTLAHDLQGLLATPERAAQAPGQAIDPQLPPVAPYGTSSPGALEPGPEPPYQIHLPGEAGVTHAPANGTAAAGAVAPTDAAPGRLTRREAEVLGLLAQGMTNKEIAAVLWLSDRTVERHITGLYRKIGAQRRTEATAFALHHGLVETDAQKT